MTFFYFNKCWLFIFMQTKQSNKWSCVGEVSKINFSKTCSKQCYPCLFFVEHVLWGTVDTGLDKALITVVFVKCY